MSGWQPVRAMDPIAPRALLSTGPVVTIGITAVVVFRLHVDFGGYLSLIAIGSAMLGGPLVCMLLVFRGLWLRSRRVPETLVRRRDLQWPGNIRIAIGVVCGALLLVAMVTGVEEWMFHRWHLRSFERVIAGESEAIPGGAVLRYETELVFAYPRGNSNIFFIYDHEGEVPTPEGVSPFPRWSGRRSFWESSRYSREQARSLGGRWYYTPYVRE